MRRSGKLLLLSLLIYFFIGDIPRWFSVREMPAEFMQSAIESGATTAIEKTDGKGLPPFDGDRNLSSSASPLSSFAVSSAVERLRAWHALSWPEQLFVHWRVLSAKLIKSELWETLAIIGATQLVVLPWIGSPFWLRLSAMAVLGAAHGLLSYWVGWDFLFGIKGNWLSQAWMTGSDRGWDGGIFGPINWAVVMLGGTLAYDLVVASTSPRLAIARLAVWGLAFMVIGYCMSCLTRLYDLDRAELAEMRARCQQEAEEKSALNAALEERRLALARLHESGENRQRTRPRGTKNNSRRPSSPWKTEFATLPTCHLRPVRCDRLGIGSKDAHSGNCWPSLPLWHRRQMSRSPIGLLPSSIDCEIIGCWERGCPIFRLSRLPRAFNLHYWHFFRLLAT